MLTFEPAGHQYKFNGKPVPGVTNALSSVFNTDFMTGPGRDRGSAVHTICQAIDEETMEDWQMPSTLGPYGMAYRAFRLDMAPKWIGIEERVWHPTYHYAGTLDRRGWINTRDCSTYCVLDIKTGEDHPAYALQLSAYLEATPHAKGFQAERVVLFLRADGTYRLKEIKTKHREDFAVFLSLLNVARWKTKNGI